MAKKMKRQPETLVELMDIILSRVCRGLKSSRHLLADACTEMEGFGIDPDAPEPEKLEILINYVENLRDEDGNMVFSAVEIQEYRTQLRKLTRRK
ncbi:MAG: hypothetical protein N3F63_02385 [Thermoplasmata archaeon]|nr:hypothetical protein [Thermoplasmata archaeon]